MAGDREPASQTATYITLVSACDKMSPIKHLVDKVLNDGGGGGVAAQRKKERERNKIR